MDYTEAFEYEETFDYDEALDDAELIVRGINVLCREPACYSAEGRGRFLPKRVLEDALCAYLTVMEGARIWLGKRLPCDRRLELHAEATKRWDEAPLTLDDRYDFWQRIKEAVEKVSLSDMRSCSDFE